MNYMPQAMNQTGYKKPLTPHTENLYTASAVPPVASTTDVLPWKSPPSTNVFMQNQQPSCLADGVCQAMEYNIWKATGTVVRLSRRFLWALCVKNDNLPAADGTYMTTALEMAQKYGVCEASLFDDDTTLPLATYADASLITQAMYDNALQYRIQGYLFLSDLTFNGLNPAIYEYGVVITGMEISDQWWTAPNGDTSWAADDILPLRPSNAANPIVSGHCVDLYAYDQLQHYLLNWWSANWGYNGRGWYRINEAPAVYEAAVILGMAPTSPAPVKPVLEANSPPLGAVETILEEVISEVKDIL